MNSDQLIITGINHPVDGSVRISGAKNATLPILAATLLIDRSVLIRNVPEVQDVSTAVALLRHFGAHVEVRPHELLINACDITASCAPCELVKKMRASVLTLGPLLARLGCAEIAFPGGCPIGSRPVNLHLEGFKAMGAHIEIKEGLIHAQVAGRLHGTTHEHLNPVTVTGTENLMMAATLAEGQTIIHHAACEPEVVDLACFLNQMGAKIYGAGTSSIVIHGVSKLHGGEFSVVPDRLEAATYLVAGAMTRGFVRVEDVVPSTLDSVLKKFEEAGAQLEIGPHWVSLNMRSRRPRAVNLFTGPYPRFPTDMQAQFMALNAVADGTSIITENMFENRFMHVPELKRMGAQIQQRHNQVFCIGQERLLSAQVTATDLRASACLVLAALVADGMTTIHCIDHIDRGYEKIEEKLFALGVQTQRICAHHTT